MHNHPIGCILLNKLKSSDKQKQILNKEIQFIKNSTIFKKYIKLAFEKYDEDKNGCLDKTGLRYFVNDLRFLLNIPKCENDTFNKIFNIIDTNKNGVIDFDDLYETLPELLPVLSSAGEQFQELVVKTFHDFDINKNGYLEESQFRLFINLICDRLGVERCSNWQYSYITRYLLLTNNNSLFDDNASGYICEDDFVTNFLFIKKEQSKNDILPINLRNNIFCDKQFKSMKIDKRLDNKEFIKLFFNLCKTLTKIKASKNFETKDGDYSENQSYQKINEFTNKNAKSLLSINDLVNSSKKTDKFQENQDINQMIEESYNIPKDDVFRNLSLESK